MDAITSNSNRRAQTPGSLIDKQTHRLYLEVNRVIGRNDGQGMADAQFAQAQGFKTIFIIGNNSEYSQKNVEIAGPLLIDGGGMYYTTMAAPASFYPDAAEFVQDFQNQYGVDPQLYAAQAYDAGGICMKAKVFCV